MNEEALIRQAQEGDAGAFERLLECHYDTLFKFAFKWCGNREDAEDVTQQACIKLARAIGQFRFESSFTTWLYRLVINCAKDWHKTQVRHSANADIQDQESDPAIVESDKAHTAVLARQLLKHLETLPAGMKETVLLVHGEGLSHSEAAQVLDLKESTISWRIHEIRKKLQSFLGPGGSL